MLNDTTIAAVYPIATSLAARGITLTADPNTPVGRLAALVHDEAKALQSVGVESYTEALREAAATPLVDGVYPHAAECDELIRKAARGVAATIHAARNEAVPVITRVVEVAAQAADIEAAKTAAPMHVVPYFHKKIWESQELASMCERHAGGNISLQLRRLGLVAPTNWTAALATGLPSLDQQIAAYLAEVSPDYLATIWNEAFTEGERNLVDVVQSRVDSKNGGVFARADAAVIVYLAANNMRENTPSGLNIELQAWRLYCAQLGAAAAAAICYHQKKREEFIASGMITLYLPAPGSADGISVYGPNYQAFLQQGGTPEAVMGAHIRGVARDLRVGLNSDQLSEFVRVWEAHHAVLSQRAAYVRRDTALRALTVAVSKAIAEQPKEKCVVDPSVQQKKLSEEVAKLHPNDMDDMYKIARHLVCGAMFAHTDVEKLLGLIDAAGVANQNLNVREAAFVGTCEYVLDWALSQIKIERRGG